MKFNLSHATQQPVPLETGETISKLLLPLDRGSLSVHQEVGGARLRAKVSRALVQGRALTRQADIVMEIKRGSMKERWGLDISCRMQENFSLELLVSGVVPHSPVWRAGLRSGHLLTTINSWEVEAIQVVEVVESVLMAGGFFITLGWLETMEDDLTKNWRSLGQF